MEKILVAGVAVAASVHIVGCKDGEQCLAKEVSGKSCRTGPQDLRTSLMLCCEGLACVPKNDGTWWCKDVAAALNKTNTTTIGPEANATADANATEIADAARKWFDDQGLAAETANYTDAQLAEMSNMTNPVDARNLLASMNLSAADTKDLIADWMKRSLEAATK